MGCKGKGDFQGGKGWFVVLGGGGGCEAPEKFPHHQTW